MEKVSGRILVAAGGIQAQSERVDRSGRKLETENIVTKPEPTPPPEQEIRSRIHELTTKEMRLLHSWLGKLIERLEDEGF